MFDDVNLIKWAWSFLALLLTLVGLFALVHALKRGNVWQPMRANKTDSRLKVVDTLALDFRRTLFLVDDGKTEHLILLSPQGEVCLTSTPKQQEETPCA